MARRRRGAECVAGRRRGDRRQGRRGPAAAPHHAAAAGARAACERLLEAGADASATADDGSTPATAAATAGFGALAEDVLARAQYAPSETDDAARARWAKAFVDAGCATSHHAAALVASNAGDRRYGEVGFWTSALILRAARAPSTARIADLGSGVGRFTLAAALLMPEAQVVGVEIAPELHAVAAKVERAESQPQERRFSG